METQLIVNNFVQRMQGRLEPHQIEAAVTMLNATDQKHPATGNIVSMIFYLQFHVDISGGKSFKGDAGGVAFPGAGALFGDVYTTDLERLYRDTHAFEFQATPVYTSLLFFDGHSNLLGHFQAGAVSIVTGIGGGSGKWG
jgi:Rhodococcus equi virulence-associated protein